MTAQERFLKHKEKIKTETAKRGMPTIVKGEPTVIGKAWLKK